MFKFSSDYSSKDQMFSCIYIIILHNSLPVEKKNFFSKHIVVFGISMLDKKKKKNRETTLYSINSNFIKAQKRKREINGGRVILALH